MCVLTLVRVFWVSVAYHMVKLGCDPIHKSLGETSDVLDVVLQERTVRAFGLRRKTQYPQTIIDVPTYL